MNWLQKLLESRLFSLAITCFCSLKLKMGRLVDIHCKSSRLNNNISQNVLIPLWKIKYPLSPLIRHKKQALDSLPVNLSLYLMHAAAGHNAVRCSILYNWCQVFLICICMLGGHLIGGEVGMEMDWKAAERGRERVLLKRRRLNGEMNEQRSE